MLELVLVLVLMLMPMLVLQAAERGVVGEVNSWSGLI
jgi:hypothetical protein